MVCDHGLRRARIVESLLGDIVQGRVQAGQHLVTQELADRFGVSHTPIREALITLAGIGIVDLPPNRGAIVRRVSAREVREACQVRKALECEATRSACGRIASDELHRLAADLRRLTVEPTPDSRSGARFVRRARTLDNRLHDLIANSCGNHCLAAELDRLKILFRTFRDLAWEFEESRNRYERLANEAREHLAIVEALLAKNRRGAAQAMSRHIRSGACYWTRAIAAIREGEP